MELGGVLGAAIMLVFNSEGMLPVLLNPLPLHKKTDRFTDCRLFFVYGTITEIDEGRP